tara:strand:- start:4513 stop:11868 length:7356 start_codon:yes stop_codon:yes gene_type:complete
MAVDRDNYDAVLESLKGRTNLAEVELPKTLGEKFGAGVSSGMLGLEAGVSLADAAFQQLTGDTYERDQALDRAARKQAISADYLKGLETFEEFLDEPDAQGFVDQLAISTGEFLPSAIASISLALLGAATGGVAFGAAAGVGRLALSTTAQKGAKKILREAFESRAKKLVKKQGVWDDLTKDGYTILQTLKGRPGFARSTRVGGLAGAYSQEGTQGTGTTYGEFVGQDMKGSREAAISAAVGFGPYAAVGIGSEVIGTGLVIAPFLKSLQKIAAKKAKTAVAGSGYASLAKEIGKGFAKGSAVGFAGGAVSEGTAEGLQQSMTIAQKFAIDGDYTTEQAKLEALEAIFKGFFGGGILGGAGRGTIQAASDGYSSVNSTLEKTRSLVKDALEEGVQEGQEVLEKEKKERDFKKLKKLFQNKKKNKIPGTNVETENIDTPIPNLENPPRGTDGINSEGLAEQTPESSSDLLAQLKVMASGKNPKKAVWLSKNSPTFTQAQITKALKDKKFFSGVVENAGTIVALDETIVNDVVQDNASPESLAIALGYSETRNATHDRAILVETAEGNEIHSETTNEFNAPAVINKLEQAFKNEPGVEVIGALSFEDIIEDRKERVIDEYDLQVQQTVDAFAEGTPENAAQILERHKTNVSVLLKLRELIPGNTQIKKPSKLSKSSPEGFIEVSFQEEIDSMLMPLLQEYYEQLSEELGVPITKTPINKVIAAAKKENAKLREVQGEKSSRFAGESNEDLETKAATSEDTLSSQLDKTEDDTLEATAASEALNIREPDPNRLIIIGKNKKGEGWLAYDGDHGRQTKEEEEAKIAEATQELLEQFDRDGDTVGRIKFLADSYTLETLNFSYPLALLKTLRLAMKQNPSAEYEIVERQRQEINKQKYKLKFKLPYDLAKSMGYGIERMEFVIATRRPEEEILVNENSEGEEVSLVTIKKYITKVVANGLASKEDFRGGGFFIQRPKDKSPKAINMMGMLWEAKAAVTAEGTYVEGDQKMAFRAFELILAVGSELGYDFFINVKRGKKIEKVSLSEASSKDLRTSPSYLYKKGDYKLTFSEFLRNQFRNQDNTFDDYATAGAALIEGIVDIQLPFEREKARAELEKEEEKKAKKRSPKQASLPGMEQNEGANEVFEREVERRATKNIEADIIKKVKEGHKTETGDIVTGLESLDPTINFITSESPVNTRRLNGRLQIIPRTKYNQSGLFRETTLSSKEQQKKANEAQAEKLNNFKTQKISKPTVEQLTNRADFRVDPSGRTEPLKRAKNPLSEAYAKVKVKANDKRWDGRLPYNPAIMFGFDLIIDNLVSQAKEANVDLGPHERSFEGDNASLFQFNDDSIETRDPNDDDVAVFGRASVAALLNREGASDIQDKSYFDINREQNDTKPDQYKSSNRREAKGTIEMSSDFRKNYAVLTEGILQTIKKFNFFGQKANVHFITYNDLKHRTEDAKVLSNNNEMKLLLKKALKEKEAFDTRAQGESSFRGGKTLRLAGKENKKGEFTASNEYVIIIDTDYTWKLGAGKQRSATDTAAALATIAHEMAHVVQLNYLDDLHFKPGIRKALYKEFLKVRDSKSAYSETNGFEEWFADQTAIWLINYAQDGRKWKASDSPYRSYFLRIAKNIVKIWSTLLDKDTSGILKRVNVTAPNVVFDQWIKSVTTAPKNTASFQRSQGQLSWDQKQLALDIVSDVLKKTVDKKTYTVAFKKIGQTVTKLLNDSPDSMELVNRVIRTAPGVIKAYGSRAMALALGGQAVSTETKGLSWTQGSSQLQAQFENRISKIVGVEDRFRLRSVKLTDEQNEAFYYAEDETISDDEIKKLSPIGYELRKYLREFYDNYLGRINPKTNKPYMDIGLLKTNTRDGGTASYFTRSLNIRELYGNPTKRALFEKYTVQLINNNSFLVEKVDKDTKKVKFVKPNLTRLVKNKEGEEERIKITVEEYAEEYVNSILRLDQNDASFERIMDDKQKDELLANIGLGMKSSLARTLAYRRIPDIEGVEDENRNVIIRDYGYPTAILRQLGLLENPVTAVLGYGRQASKRFNLELIGGEDFLNEEINKSAERYRPLMKKAVRAILGKVDSPMSPLFRQINSWGLFSNIVTTLTFSVLASFPDFAGPFLRSRELSSFKVGAGLLKEYATDPSRRLEFIQFAMDIGAVTQDAMADLLMNAAEMDYMNDFTKKGTEWFFRAILLESFTKFTRVFAANMGKAFITSLAQNTEMDPKQKKRYLEELNLTEKDVLTWLNTDKQDLTTPAGIKVAAGIYTFVDESIIRPNSSQRPMWASNPYFALVWQLKGFFYAYGKTIMGGQGREMYNRYKEAGMGAAAMPFAMMALTILPLTMLGLEVREYIKLMFATVLPGAEAFGEKEYLKTNNMPWDSYMYEIFDRSGVAGPFGLLLPLVPGHEFGGPFEKGASILGPTSDKVFDLFKYGPTDSRFWKEQAPLYGQIW